MEYGEKAFAKLKHGLSYSLGFVSLLWIILILDFILPIDFASFGVYPRTFFGLIGIPLSVFLHSGISHLVSNSIPLVVLMTTLLIVYPKPAFPAMFFMVIYSNILVWILGRSANHIGASGLVYSLAAFLIAAGYFKKRPFFALVALVIGFLYGGLVWGIFPGLVGWYVSWESHLFGAIVGVYLAHFYKKDL
jgi:membrane associated rhomboid family serine protease